MGALRALGPRMHMESFRRRDAVEPRGIHSLSARGREAGNPRNGYLGPTPPGDGGGKARSPSPRLRELLELRWAKALRSAQRSHLFPASSRARLSAAARRLCGAGKAQPLG